MRMRQNARLELLDDEVQGHEHLEEARASLVPLRRHFRSAAIKRHEPKGKGTGRITGKGKGKGKGLKTVQIY